MNRKLNNIDKLFHENLAGAGDQPPAHIWEGIGNALDTAKGKAIAQKKENRRRYAFAALFLIAAGVAIWLSNKDGIATKAVVTAETNASANAAADRLPANGMGAATNKQADQPSATRVFQGPGTPSLHEPAIERKGTGALKNEKTSADLSLARTLETPAPGTTAESASNPVNNAITQPVAQNSPLSTVEAGYPGRQTAETIDIGHSGGTHIGVAPGMLPALASAKNSASTVQVKRESRLSITAFFAPDITTRNLEQNFGTGRDERKEELLRTEKNSQLDFTVGARIEYKLNDHLSLQSGLSFSTNTIDIAQKTIFARLDKDGALKYRFNFSSGYTYFNPKTLSAPQFLGDSAQALSSSSTLHYVNIPLAVKYNLPSGRFNFSLQAGMTARFITKQSIDAVYASNGSNEKSRANEIQGLKTSYFNGVVGVGADYSLNSKMALTLFPSFNFATSSINRDAPVKAYPNTLSLAVGVKFQM
jgi:hypothetical protein